MTMSVDRQRDRRQTERMPRKRNYHLMLVGMSTHEATADISMVVPGNPETELSYIHSSIYTRIALGQHTTEIFGHPR